MTGARPTRLEPAVEPARDHILGRTGEITLVEYGSYACRHCHAAHEVIIRLRHRFGARLRYVFRHRPLRSDPQAEPAAVLAEYAALTTGEFWPLHDALMQRGPTFSAEDLEAIAAEFGIPPAGERDAEMWQAARARVRHNAESATASGALVTPTFFVNGRRYEGAWDESSLAEAMLGSLGHRLHAASLDFARWGPSTGVLLLFMTLLALGLTNSPLGPAFAAFWETPAGFAVGGWSFSLPLLEWVNDLLLTVFFLVVGLEIKRELTVGRLANRRAAALPVAAALGGMAVPALLYLAIVGGGPLTAGWAVPMATDTAFAVALIVLLGPRVPVELRVFLTAAVIVDDLVAIVVLAVFYAGQIDLGYLAAAVAASVALAVLNRSGIYRALPYAVVGIVLWACLHAAGLHATLAGVILAIATPTRPPPDLRALMTQAEVVFQHEMRAAGESAMRHGPSEAGLRALDAIHDRIESPASKLLRGIEPWSSYVVLPLFALANAGVAWSSDVLAGRGDLVLAIVVGLALGKPLGILGMAWIAVRSGIAVKPDGYGWLQLAGAGALAGIGFTMSLFISGQAFPDPADFAAAKTAIFIASLIAGGAGTGLLVLAARRQRTATGSASSDTP